MFSSEIRNLLVQVITSWQVIAVTVVLVIYIFIINYAAKIRQRSSSGWQAMPKSKPEKNEVPAPSDNDDLGLE